MISLAEFVEEHGEALTYDLITRTNYQLDDIGGALSWSSLHSFIKFLPGDSALAREAGEISVWDSRMKTNAILADIYDSLQLLNANLVAYASGGKTKPKLTPYPRPGREDNTKRTFGKGPLPLEQMREWIRSKQHG